MYHPAFMLQLIDTLQMKHWVEHQERKKRKGDVSEELGKVSQLLSEILLQYYIIYCVILYICVCVRV